MDRFISPSAWLLLALLLGRNALANMSEADQQLKVDCGVNALYVLSHLERVPVSEAIR